ncbi:MAG: selenium-dependent molybdenum cofactor biosynthesis protein YqeB [Clostridia bacterium]
MLVLIRGAGDLATGIALRVHRAGIKLVLTDIAQPTAIRRSVSISRAIYDGLAMVEDVTGILAKDANEALAIIADGNIPVLVDEKALCIQQLRPDAVVDAILAKYNTGTSITDAPIVIGLGPGFTAGADCHAAIETMRGHDLGRVLYAGSPAPNTGVPGEIGGFSAQRVMHAPSGGVFKQLMDIGALVKAGDAVAYVNGMPVEAEIDGVLRGILPDGISVHKGMKCADVDPRGNVAACFSVSDKARSLGGAVLEALLHFYEVSNNEQ